jgi:hypothetical protein
LYSLFKVKVNWGLYLGLLIVVRLLFPELSWFSYAALMIAAYQFMLLFYSFGSVIPVRYLLGAFMCLQMYIGPALAYNGLDKYQRGFLKMQVPEDQYFIYALPAVICFIIGLHIRAGMLDGEVVDQNKIKLFVTENPKLPYLFIGIGFVSSFVSGFFGSELGFVFTLLASFKYVGAFMIILGNKELKPVTLFLVYGSIIASSLGNAMFHDLLTWLIFLGAVLAIKYKPSVRIKAIVTFFFLLLATSIQMIKGDYRDATWKGGEAGGLETLQKTVEESQERTSFFSLEKLGGSNVRINQGFIVTNIMRNIPEKEPFAKGEELKIILEAAIMPRILAPNKLNAGDRAFFMKYSGMPLAKGTSMGLSSVGDGYINFGIVGGCIFMFFYGLLFNEVLRIFKYNEKDYPALILFIGLVFYFPIRPDCELQTILGHLFKSCFLLFVMMQIWKHVFKVTPTQYRFIPQE